MWGDTLLAAERVFTIRVMAWSAVAILLGTAVLVATFSSRARPQLLRSFATACALLGVLELLVFGYAYAQLELRDVSGAARLDRIAWLQAGLYLGTIALGAAIALTGWRVGRSLRAVGTGAAVLLHACALLLFVLQLVALVSR
jgi:hypothetical protein